ncbi:MAG: putative Ig domain-containing protein [Sphingobium sp.]|nr:MAG: putative Ig domain-containing protein [Sphingobium sp.]
MTDEVLNGGAAADELSGGEGDDSLAGGSGDDYITGLQGDDRLFGEAGNDVLEGADGDDVLSGGSGNDVLLGNGGNDSLTGGSGNDIFVFGNGDTVTDFNIGEDLIDISLLGVTADTFTASVSITAVNGGARITINGESMILLNIDHSALSVANFGLQIDANAPIVDVPAPPVADEIVDQSIQGTSSFDEIFGGEGDDTVAGGSGDDYIAGLQGNDQLFGESGNDVLEGGDGDDALSGGSGNDLLLGDVGNDSLTGGSGNDIFVFGHGDTVTDFNIGEDLIDISLLGVTAENFAALVSITTVSGGARITIGDESMILLNIDGSALTAASFGLQIDANAPIGGPPTSPVANEIVDQAIRGSGALDDLLGGAGDDTIAGGSGDDYLAGLQGDDRLFGGSGSDLLEGGEGNDTLSGGSDNDYLDGNLGNDSLTGGSGNDIFAFGHGDTITDFSIGEDLIDLSLLGVTAENFATSVSITAVNGGARITIGTESMMLANTDSSALTLASFVLQPSVNEDTAWIYKVAADAFSDVDADTFTYTATLANGDPLPAWLSFVAATRTFSGTPSQDFNGNISLTVTASDGSTSVSDTFVLTVNPVEDEATGTLAVTGTAEEGGTVSADLVATDADGAVTTSYQWQISSDGSNWTDLSGATAATYQIASDQSQVGQSLRVVATTTDALNGTTVFTSEPTAAIANVEDEATGTLAVTGTAEEGGTVSADLVATDADGAVTTSYQWQISSDGSNWTDLSGATAATYQIASDQSQVGQSLRVVATTTDALNGTTVFTSEPTAAIANVEDEATGTLAVTGTAEEGGTVSADLVATDADGAVTTSYQWQISSDGSNWTDLSGATAATYQIASDQSQVGQSLRVVATTTDALNGTTVFTSEPTAAIANVEDEATGTLAVTGTAEEGGTVSADLVATDADGAVTTSYQWQISSDGSNWTDLSGATAATYQIASDQSQVGQSLRVVATTTDALNGTTVFTSEPTAAIANVEDEATGTLAVTGTAEEGGTVSADLVATDADGAVTTSYQWQISSDGSNWTDLSGATAATYQIASDQSQVGQSLRVVATTTDALNGTTVFTSEPTAAIANVEDEATGTLAVTGTAEEGGTVSADLVATDADGAVTTSYQWQISSDGSNWTDLSGATAATYQIASDQSQVGQSLRVVATTTDALNGTTVFTSEPTAAIANVEDEATGTLAVTGTAEEGGTVSADLVATDADGAVTTSYQWQISSDGSNWTDLSGATAATYQIASDQSQVGQSLRVVATTTDALNGTTVFTSEPTAAIANVEDEATGTLAVTGTAEEGGTVSADLVATDADGAVTTSYQWQISSDGSNWTDLSGATAATYQIASDQSQVGQSLRVVATTTDALNGTTVFTSEPTAAIANVEDEATGTLAVTGTAEEGGTVSADLVATDADGAVTTSYQWQISSDGSNWTDLSGATAATYQIASDQSQVGQSLRVVATTTDALNGTTVFTSEPTAAIANVEDEATGTLAVTGTAEEGGTVSADLVATDADGAVTTSYQWQISSDGSNWTDLSGATAATYQIASDQSQVGQSLRVVATTTDALNGTTVFTSEPTAAIANVEDEATGTLAVTGTAEEGGTVSADLVATDADGAVTTSYQWQISSDGSNWTDLSGATAATYQIASDQSQVGQSLRVVATTTDALNGTTVFTSEPTAAIANVEDEATGTLAVTGTAEEGGTVSADLVATDADGAVTTSYQWQISSDGSNWTDLSGATAATYQIASDQSQVGQSLRVVATTTDALNGTTVFTSEPTAAIANVEDEATGTLAVTGTAEEGGTVSADLVATDADGAVTTSYQWQISSDGSNWTDLSGATAATYQIASDQSQVGQSLRVVATTTDALNGTTVFTSEPTAAIANVEDEATGTLAVTGTAEEGGTVSADLVATDADGAVTTSYQWQISSDGSNWTDLSGATAATYQIASDQSQVGQSLRVVATTTDALNGTTVFTSEPTAAIANVEDEATGTLAVTGTAEEGGTVSADLVATDADGAVTTSYQWQISSDGSNWTDLSGATAATYQIASDQSQVGQSLRVVATTTDALNGTTVFTSEPTAAIANVEDEATGTLAVTGTAEEGGTVSADLVATDADGAVTTSYQWQISSDGSNWTDLSGATAATYQIASDQSQVGQSLRVVATTTDALNGTTVFTSEPTAAIANVEDEATGTLAVTGTAEEGGTVSADLVATDADGAVTTSYQWQISSDGSNWTDLSGATAATYQIASDQSQVGQSLRVVATTTDALNGTTVFTSEPTAAIANVEDEATGTLAVTGTAEEGGTVSADLVATDADGAVTTSYQWQISSDGSNWTDLSGATAATYQIASDQSQVGQSLRVVATTTDALNGTTVFTSEPTAAIANVEDEATGTLAVTGTAEEGGTVSADLVATDADGAVTTSYQWQISSDGSNWTDLSGATAATYQIASDQSQVGQSLRVVATTTDALNGTTVFTSEPTAAIANVNDAPIVSAVIADQVSAENTAWSYTVPAGTFTDVDGDTLTYTATLANGDPLPTWLNFNAATRTFSGMPPFNFTADYSLAVTASDGSTSVSDSFVLTVNAVNNAPVVDVPVPPAEPPPPVVDVPVPPAQPTPPPVVNVPVPPTQPTPPPVVDVPVPPTQPTPPPVVDVPVPPTQPTLPPTSSEVSIDPKVNTAGTKRADTLTGTSTDDQLFGKKGNDSLFGMLGNDKLDGGKGHDKLWGGQGNDTLLGGNGNDYLDGGAGADTLTGGKGKDTFKFGAGDSVLDFQSGTDLIDLQGFGVTAANFNEKAKIVNEGGAIKLLVGEATMKIFGSNSIDVDDFIFGAENDISSLLNEVLPIVNSADTSGGDMKGGGDMKEGVSVAEPDNDDEKIGVSYGYIDAPFGWGNIPQSDFAIPLI